MKELRHSALEALLIRDPAGKCDAVAKIATARLLVDPAAQIAVPAGESVPGRPARPRLVAPSQVAPRTAGTQRGRAALLHALAHIEFNAINLALDAVWRFPGLPPDYYLDWLTVAQEEARHFTLLCGRLASVHARYGDFDAHDGLWETAERTRHDALARMALVPRVLEARGLDASPLVRARLAGAGDHDSAAVIDLILRDEIGHVAIGNRWFHRLCTVAGRDPLAVDEEVRSAYGAPASRPPYNAAARRAAGFSAEELARLDVRQAVDR